MVSWVVAVHSLHAGVAELADALDLGSSTHKYAGSSPVARIAIYTKASRVLREAFFCLIIHYEK